MKNALRQMRLHEAKHTPQEAAVVRDLWVSFERPALSLAQRLQNFPRHVRRQDISRFLAKYEVFSQAHPVNRSRIIGFDTFKGFPSLDDKGRKEGRSYHLQVGAFQISGDSRPEPTARPHPGNRVARWGRDPDDSALRGRASAPADQPHLSRFRPLLSHQSGARTLVPARGQRCIVAFAEFNSAEFPGETTALLESLDLSRVELRVTPLDPHISFLIKMSAYTPSLARAIRAHAVRMVARDNAWHIGGTLSIADLLALGEFGPAPKVN
jgi:hypothetical protein